MHVLDLCRVQVLEILVLSLLLLIPLRPYMELEYPALGVLNVSHVRFMGCPMLALQKLQKCRKPDVDD